MMQQVALVVLLLVAYTHASCYWGAADLDSETGQSVCEVAEGVTIKEGEHLLTQDCFNCTCTATEFHCCGVGIAAGTIGEPPEGTVLVLDPPCGFHFESVGQAETAA